MTGIRCQRMELGEPDASGRRRPVPIPGSEFEIACDMVVVAIGTRSNPLLTATAPELNVNQWGYIVTDEYGMTSMPGVFAGGDIVRGAATVILAMGDGKRSAASIDAYLRRRVAAGPARGARTARPTGEGRNPGLTRVIAFVPARLRRRALDRDRAAAQPRRARREYAAAQYAADPEPPEVSNPRGTRWRVRRSATSDSNAAWYLRPIWP